MDNRGYGSGSWERNGDTRVFRGQGAEELNFWLSMVV